MSKIKENPVLSPLSNRENAKKAIRLSLQFPLRHDDFLKMLLIHNNRATIEENGALAADRLRLQNPSKTA